MSVDKIILRSFLSSLVAILLLLCFSLAALFIGLPSTMMEFTYSLGMEESSIRNAQRAYDRNEDIYFIAFATQTAIEIEDYKSIDVCGMQMVEDTEFTSYCQFKNEQNNAEKVGDYGQYIYGQICIAKYKRAKKQEAVECAFAWTNEESFPRNNAIVALALTCLRAEDNDTKNMIREKMNERAGKTSNADKVYFDEILALVNG